MAIVAPGGFFQNLSNHSAQLLRLNSNSMPYKPRTVGSNIPTTMALEGGVVLQSKSLGTNQQASANMSVIVHRGKALVEGTDALTQGNYGIFNDGDVTLAIATSDPTRLRVDIVYVQVRDAAVAGSSNDVRLLVATGNPATGVADETVLPTNSLVLSYVNVRANTTQILDSDITDRRRWLTAAGGVKIIRSFQATDPGVINGDLRYYQGRIQGYEPTDSTWRTLNEGHVTQHFAQWFGAGVGYSSATNPATLTTFSIPDPGYPYMIEADFAITAANGNGSTRWDVSLLDNSSSGTEICSTIVPLAVTAFTVCQSYTSWYGPLTGARTLYVVAGLNSGTGNLLIDVSLRNAQANIRLVGVAPLT